MTNRSQVANAVTDIIDGCLVVMGHDKKKFKDEERFIIEKEIVNDIFSKFIGLSIEEIRLACSMGCRGEYKTKPDEVVYFSVSSVYQWIKSYIATTKREAIAKQARYEQDSYQKVKPTQEQLEQLEKEFIEDCILAPYRHYLSTDEYLFDNRGNVVYNKLNKLNLIPFPPSIKLQFMEKAKEIVKATLFSSPTHDNKKLYEEVENGTGDGHKLVISEAKDIALRQFFKDLKDVNADLEKLIKG